MAVIPLSVAVGVCWLVVVSSLSVYHTTSAHSMQFTSQSSLLQAICSGVSYSLAYTGLRVKNQQR